MMFRVIGLAVGFWISHVGVGVLSLVRADGPGLSREDQAVLLDALDLLNMSVEDLTFAKDVGQPDWSWPTLSSILHNPLEMPTLADQLLATVQRSARRDLVLRMLAWVGAEPTLDQRITSGDEQTHSPLDVSSLPTSMQDPVQSFYHAAFVCRTLLDQAFRSVSRQDRELVTLDGLSGWLQADHDESMLEALVALGINESLIPAWREALDALDREPRTRRYLEGLDAIDLPALIRAGAALVEASDRLRAQVMTITDWPETVIHLASDLGPVVIGTLGHDVYDQTAFLILDPGGGNHYRGSSGVALGLDEPAISVILDLGGGNRYEGDQLLGPGTAIFGVSVVLDQEGGSDHIMSGMGSASAFAGFAWLESGVGHDVFKARVLGQAAAIAGVAVLDNRGGDNLYDIGWFGQGASGVQGIGLLIDRSGHDRYLAGHVQPDHERNQDRFLTMAQGFSIGARPFAGGGVGAVVDLAGNDTYVADIFGQGVGYYYSLGMLIDVNGHDTYTLHQYGQGAGIHLAGGLLADLGGNDQYTGYILAQGAAHDYAVGMLIDHRGDDTFSADHHSQGRALNNAFALLLDREGDDAYFARQPDAAQGIGNIGGFRDYGSLSLLVDLGGRDRYSAPVNNNQSLLRPLFGVIHDVEVEP